MIDWHWYAVRANYVFFLSSLTCSKYAEVTDSSKFVVNIRLFECRLIIILSWLDGAKSDSTESGKEFTSGNFAPFSQ